MNTKKLPLAFWIFVGLVIGIVAGLALMAIPGGVDFAKTYVKPFGTIFLNLIKFIVVPIVLFSITAGIISMGDIKKLGSVGVKTIVYYMCTTALAVVIALVLANLCRGLLPAPGQAGRREYTASDPVSFMDTLVNIFPANVIEPMRSASMLQVIVIAILFGVGILVAGEKGLVCAQVVDSFNEVSMKVMDLIHPSVPRGRGLPAGPRGGGERPQDPGCPGRRAAGGLHRLCESNASVRLFLQHGQPWPGSPPWPSSGRWSPP